MKIAVVGSRSVLVEESQLAEHLAGATELVSGGARGVDFCAANYAKKNHIKLTEFLPRYDRYGRGAPMVRNKKIVDYADKILDLWAPPPHLRHESSNFLSYFNQTKKASHGCLFCLAEKERFDALPKI